MRLSSRERARRRRVLVAPLSPPLLLFAGRFRLRVGPHAERSACCTQRMPAPSRRVLGGLFGRLCCRRGRPSPRASSCSSLSSSSASTTGQGSAGRRAASGSKRKRPPVPQSPVVHPELCGDADDRARAVFRWVQQRGAFVHRNLSIARFPLPGGGAVRGMAASGDIRANETLIKIPPDVVVSVAPPPPPLPPPVLPSSLPCPLPPPLTMTPTNSPPPPTTRLLWAQCWRSPGR